jgi:hypothetical protein
MWLVVRNQGRPKEESEKIEEEVDDDDDVHLDIQPPLEALVVRDGEGQLCDHPSNLNVIAEVELIAPRTTVRREGERENGQRSIKVKRWITSLSFSVSSWGKESSMRESRKSISVMRVLCALHGKREDRA